MAGPAIFAAPYVAPAVGEGILWGAGALGTGLAALGIIDNKDAIEQGIRDFGTFIRTGTENGIRSLSRSMSPKGPAIDPSVDKSTGRYIAVSDATRVQTPFVQTLLPEALNSPARGRVMSATASGGSGGAQAGATQSKSRRKPAANRGTAGASTAGGSTAAPNPEDKNKNKRPFFGNTRFPLYRGYGQGPIIKDVGRFVLRDVPATEFGIDLVRNASGLIKSGSDPQLEYTPNFGLTKYGNPYGWLWTLGGYTTTKPVTLPTADQFASTYKETDAAVDDTQRHVAPVDTFTREPIVPDTARVRNGIVFVTGQ